MAATVLIIDDDRGFTTPVRGALEARGHVVDVQEDASLELIKALRPSVILVNAELPRSSGFSICSRVRKDREVRTTPILLTTSATSQEALDKHAERPERANAYVIKPIEPEEAADLLEGLLSSAPPPLNRPSPGEFGDETKPLPLTDSEEVPLEGSGPRSSTAAQEQGTADPPPPPLPRSDTIVSPPPGNSTVGPSSPGERSLAPQASDDISGPRAAEQDRVVDAGARDLNGSAEPWPRARFDAAWDRAMTGAEGDPQLTARRGAPEERLEQLRSLVKRHEHVERQLRGLYREMSERGQELGRRVLGLQHELLRAQDDLQFLEAEKSHLQARLEETETSFRDFHEEVTRIFTEKDAEERQTLERLALAEEGSVALQRELDAARERQDDDARRLRLFQDEIEELNERFEAKVKESSELRQSLEDSRQSQSDLEARLGTTESIAEERGEALSELEDRLDEQAFEIERLKDGYTERDKALELERAETKRAHEAELERVRADLRAEREAELARLGAELRADREALEERHQEALARAEEDRVHLQRQHEAELDEVEKEHLAAVERLRAQAEASAATAEAHHRQVVEAAQTELRDATEERARLREALDESQESLFSSRDALDRSRAEVEELKSEIATLSTALEASLRTEKERTEDQEAHIAALEGRLKEETRLRAQAEASAAEQADLEAQAEARRRADLAQAEDRARALQNQLQKVQEERERQHREASEKADETNGQLENANAELARLREQLRAAQARADDRERRLFEAEEANDTLTEMLRVSEDQASAQRGDADDERARAEEMILRLTAAEAKAVELDEARADAEAKAQEADEARAKAEAKALEADEARANAEARALQADEGRALAEAQAVHADEARARAEAHAVRSDEARFAAEAQAVRADEARALAESRSRNVEVERAETGASEQGELGEPIGDDTNPAFDASVSFERLAEAERGRQEAEARAAALERSLRDAEEEIETSGERVLDLHSRLDELRAELAELQSRSHASHASAAPELRAAEQARQNAEKARSRLTAELERQREREAELQKHLAARTGELKAARLEIQRLSEAAALRKPGEQQAGTTSRELLEQVVTLEELEADAVDLGSSAGPGPFAALIDEIRGGSPSVRGGGALLDPASLPSLHPEDQADEDEREVTEIIDLKKLES